MACAAEDPRALGARFRKRGLHRLEGGAVDEWPDEGAGIEWIADRQAAISLLEVLHQFVADRPVHDEPR